MAAEILIALSLSISMTVGLATVIRRQLLIRRLRREINARLLELASQ